MTEKNEILKSYVVLGISITLTTFALICLFAKPKLTPSSAFSLSGLSGLLGGCFGAVVWVFLENSDD